MDLDCLVSHLSVSTVIFNSGEINTHKEVRVMFSLFSLATFMDILIGDPKNQRFTFIMNPESD